MYFDAATLGRIIAVANDPRHFQLRRALVMDGLVHVFGALHALNFVGETIDEIRHADYRDIDVGSPIYIVAAPRSGTTFLHRLMSHDPRFATFTLYQTIFSTITASEIADRVMTSGGLLAKLSSLAQGAIDQTFGGWEGVHDTGLGSDEEDEAIWTLTMATPAVLLLLPDADAFDHLRFIDRLPEAKKKKLVATYRAALQRRLHRHPGKTLLLKNVLLPGRFEIVTRAAPGARFVHIVRHPYEVIPSSLSLFTLPWTVTAPEAYGATEQTRRFADLMIEYYRFFYDREREAAATGDQRFISVRYRDLVTDPMAQLARIYTQYELPWNRGLEARFQKELRGQEQYRSGHSYSLEQFGLTKQYVADKLGDVMDHYGFER